VTRPLLVLIALLAAADDHPLSSEQREKLDKDLGERIGILTEELKSAPKSVDTYSRRGDAHFKRGGFKESVADYEKMVELDPALDAGHWRRGIAYFYAGQHEKAARQFEAYRSHDDVDRENGIWRYFSQAKAFGMEKAKAGLLKYAKDDREPFPDLYQLFEGKRTPDQILTKIKAAEIDDEAHGMRHFYAHLYIGLNFAVENKPEEALRHLRKAVENKWAPNSGYGPEYMWHVGRLHYEMLARPKKD
jgi:lipoprotein NlpI